jgi:hypothetical protein
VASGHKDATPAVYILGLGLTVTVAAVELLVTVGFFYSHLDHTVDFDWGIPHTSYSYHVYFIQYNVLFQPFSCGKI